MKIIVVTTTLYEEVGEIRAQLALRTLTGAQSLNIPVVVVDGGSPVEWIRLAKGQKALIFPEESSGIGNSRRQALRLGSQFVGSGGIVIWMEAEKCNLVSFIPRIVEPIIKDGFDLIIPGRRRLSTYPPEQVLTEKLGNLYFRLLTGKALDIWFGPRVIGPKAMPCFLGNRGDSWDSITTPVLDILARGLLVGEVVINYHHPPEQTAAEAGNVVYCQKRIFQLQTIVTALQKEAHLLEPNTK